MAAVAAWASGQSVLMGTEAGMVVEAQAEVGEEVAAGSTEGTPCSPTKSPKEALAISPTAYSAEWATLCCEC